MVRTIKKTVKRSSRRSEPEAPEVERQELEDAIEEGLGAPAVPLETSAPERPEVVAEPEPEPELEPPIPITRAPASADSRVYRPQAESPQDARRKAEALARLDGIATPCVGAVLRLEGAGNQQRWRVEVSEQ